MTDKLVAMPVRSCTTAAGTIATKKYSNYTPYETACTHKWDFNKSDSSNVDDGVGSLLATNSGATSTAINSGYDYAFDGSNDSMTMGTNTIGISSGDFTIEVIASITVEQTGQLMSRFNSIATKNWGWELFYYASTDQLVFDSWNNNTQNIALGSSKTDWTNNKVYHFFITGAPAGGSNNYTMYWMNGTTPTSTDTTTYAGSPDSSQSINLYFGRRQDTAYYFKGGMYLVRVHNAVLTPEQMTTNYNAELWRYNDVVTMPVRGCTTAVGTVVTKKSSTIAMSCPGCTAAAGHVTPMVTHIMSVPNCTTATGTITFQKSQAPTAPCPDAVTYLDHVTTLKTSTLTVSVPGCIADVGGVTPSVGITFPEGAVPNCTTAAGAVTTRVAPTLSAPDCTTSVPPVSVLMTVHCLPPEFDDVVEWPEILTLTEDWSRRYEQ